MSRSRKFVNGLVLTYGYQGLLMLVGLWLTPFYLTRIGQHDYGLWLVGTQLLTYLTLTDFGVVALLPQETAYATGRSGSVENASDLPQIVGQTAKIVLYQLPVVVILAFALWLTIPAEWQALKGPLTVVLIGFVVAFPLRIFPGLLQGLQDLRFANALQIVNWALSTATTVWMVVAGYSLYALAFGWLIGQTLFTPIYIYRLRARFPGVLPNRLPALPGHLLREQLGKGFWINVSQVAQLLMANTDLIIIGKLLGPAAVVPYACTSKLPAVLSNQVSLLMHVAAPGLCELKSGESRERLFHALVSLSHGVLAFSGLVFCLVLLMNRWFVTWWVTAGQFGGMLLTTAILVNMLFVHWDTVAAYSVFCFGHQRRISLTNLGNGLVTALGALGLTAILGPIGAPLGSLAGTSLIGLPFNLAIIARDTGVRLPQLAWAMVGAWLWRFGLVAGAVGLAGLYWSPKNLASAVMAGVCVSAGYIAVMLPNIMRSPLGGYIRHWLDSLRDKNPELQKVAL